jgi:hypothetical protein
MITYNISLKPEKGAERGNGERREMKSYEQRIKFKLAAAAIYYSIAICIARAVVWARVSNERHFFHLDQFRDF